MDCTECGKALGPNNATGFCGKHYKPTSFRYVSGPRLTEDDIANLRVDRDPCSYCGVRADVGCKHQRQAS